MACHTWQPGLGSRSKELGSGLVRGNASASRSLIHLQVRTTEISLKLKQPCLCMRIDTLSVRPPTCALSSYIKIRDTRRPAMRGMNREFGDVEVTCLDWFPSPARPLDFAAGLSSGAVVITSMELPPRYHMLHDYPHTGLAHTRTSVPIFLP